MTSPHNNPQAASASSTSQLRGTVRVPGDKSISHRALMLASQALGITTIHGLLEGEDVLRTAEALKQCGVPIAKKQDIWTVSGRGIGGLHEPTEVLDMGNAGTAARLMMGLLAPYPYNVQFTGDESLKKRPMKRVITPLELVGAEFLTREGGRLPLAMKGTATSHAPSAAASWRPITRRRPFSLPRKGIRTKPATAEPRTAPMELTA